MVTGLIFFPFLETDNDTDIAITWENDADNDGYTLWEEHAGGSDSDSNPNSLPSREFVLEDKVSEWNSTNWLVYNGPISIPQSNNAKPSLLASQLNLGVLGNYPPGYSDIAQIAGSTSVTVSGDVIVRKVHFWSDANKISLLMGI